MLAENQVGFRIKKDTLQAATVLWKTIQSKWATQTNSIGNFLKFRKAFDTVDQEISHQKLYGLGVHRNVHILIACYSGDRKQFLKLNSEKSNIQLVKQGVVQRSTLGPLLFFEYINDNGSNSNIFDKFFLYAAESVLIENSPSENGDLIHLQTWLVLYKVYLNHTK